MITCPVLWHLNGRNLRVSGEEPELPEPVKDLVRYPHGDAVAAPRLATSNALAAGRGTDSLYTIRYCTAHGFVGG